MFYRCSSAPPSAAAACRRLLAAALLASSAAAVGGTAPAPPNYDIKVRIGIDAAANRGTAVGTMKITGWDDGGIGTRCLYLPYADPEYDFDPIRDFDLLPRKYAKAEPRRGDQHVRILTPGLMTVYLSPHVVQIHGPLAADGLVVQFDSSMPRWADADRDEWVFSDFHPQPLVECPQAPADSRTFWIVPGAHITATLARPAGWQVASPGLNIGALAAHRAGDAGEEEFELALDGRKLVVALLRGFKHWVLPVPGTAAEVYYRDPAFEKLIPTMQNALSVQAEIFGPPPFPHLVILETADVEKSSAPGLIAVNHPHQAGLAELQADVLNWSDWQVTSFVAEQWFGASMTIRSLDDLWLLRGFVDFATIEALAAMPERYSLFRPEAGATAADQVNFDYRQTQDLVAAGLTYLHPYNAVTDDHYRSLEPFTQQHSLSYMRHALALRQINWTLGRATFRALLRRFATAHRGQAITPREFGTYFEQEARKLDGQGGGEPVTYLKQWWATDEWPDFELLGVDDEAGGAGEGHHVTVTLAQNNGFSLPVSVTATDEDGKTYTTTAKPAGDSAAWVAEVRTDSAVDAVEIDHSHQVFDWNRFNNKDSWADLNFFPGNAQTFADDAYTVLWLPLASQLPGQPLTVLLVGEGFRYMHNSITGILTYQPSTHIPGYSLYYLTDFPKLGSYLVMDSYQNKGLSYANERLVDGGFYKTVSFIKNPYIEYGLRLRDRQRLSDMPSDHQTVAFKAQVTPLNQYGPCTYSAKLELERTAHALSEAYRYDRDFGIAEGTCKATSAFEVGLRAFSGQLTHKEFVAGSDDNIRFHPQDVDEARLRIDEPALARVDGISTYGVDLLIPAPLPVPDSFYVLKRETRYRVFYDYGQSHSPAMEFRDAGIGLWVPMGGDLVGKGSVSLLNFSALMVLYRQAGSYHSQEPGFLFDFDFFGKL